MAEKASRRGAVDLGVPLMIMAFAVMGGFMYWLNDQAAAERAIEIVEDTIPEDTGYTGTATVIPAADIQLDASPFEGQEVRIEDVPVASLLGTQGFWAEMPNGNPFLVSMSEGLMAEGLNVSSGDMTSIVGTMLAVNDSIVSAWADAGTISDGDRLAAEFATHFINATAVDVSAAAPDAGGGQ